MSANMLSGLQLRAIKRFGDAIELFLSLSQFLNLTDLTTLLTDLYWT
jgi:hypothetical protein